MLVGDLMTRRFAYVYETATLSHAAEVLALTQFNDLIVVDEEKKIIGTLSDGDVMRSLMPDIEELYATEISYVELNEYFDQFIVMSKEKPIMPLIIRNYITLSPEDTIVKAVTIMLNNKIIRLPVVVDGTCIGVLGRNDISWGLFQKSLEKGNDRET